MKIVLSYFLILSASFAHSQAAYDTFEIGENYIHQRIDDSVGFNNSANGFED